MARHDAPFDNVDTAADDTCLLAFTSGTTGQPKATMHFHRDVMASCVCFPQHVLRAAPDDVFIGSPPLAFTFGLGGLTLFPMQRRRLDRAAREGRPARAARGASSRIGATVLLHRADLVPRHGRRRAREARSARATAALLRKCVVRRRGAARRDARALEARRPASRSSTASARPRCCTSSSPPTRRTRGPAPPARRCPAIAPRVDRRRRQATCPPARSASSRCKGPTGCRYLDDPRQAELRAGRLEPHRRRLPAWTPTATSSTSRAPTT